MMIKLMDRVFAPVAIALSFVAGNGDRSGDELSIVESFSDTAREGVISAAITIHALMTCARAPRPPPLRSCADGPPRVGPRRADPAPFVAATSFRTRPCFPRVQSSLRRRGRRPR